MKLLLILSATILCGCRTAGPRIIIQDCPGAHIVIPSRTDADLGKQVPVQVTAPISQNGPASATAPNQTLLDVPTPEPDGTEEPEPAPVERVPDPE